MERASNYGCLCENSGRSREEEGRFAWVSPRGCFFVSLYEAGGRWERSNQDAWGSLCGGEMLWLRQGVRSGKEGEIILCKEGIGK